MLSVVVMSVVVLSMLGAVDAPLDLTSPGGFYLPRTLLQRGCAAQVGHEWGVRIGYEHSQVATSVSMTHYRGCLPIIRI